MSRLPPPTGSGLGKDFAKKRTKLLGSWWAIIMSMIVALPFKDFSTKLVSKLLKFTHYTTSFPRRKEKHTRLPWWQTREPGCPGSADKPHGTVGESQAEVKWQCNPWGSSCGTLKIRMVFWNTKHSTWHTDLNALFYYFFYYYYFIIIIII